MKTKKLLLALLIMFCSSITLFAAFPTSGDGSANNPYKIATADELGSVRDAINLAGGVGVATANYELTADIDLSATATWVGIGTSSPNQFKGKLDGKGFKISGIKRGSATLKAGAGVMGLIGVAEGISVSNLEINVAYYVTNASSSSCGGLIAQITGGTNVVSNCKITGVIDVVSTSTGNPKAAGVLGQLALTSEITIINTTVDASLTAFTFREDKPACYAAGILAEPAATATLNIINCCALGSVSAKNSNGGATYAGGILASGYNSKTDAGLRIIANCYAANSVEGYTNVGGIVAYMGANTGNMVTNCIALNSHIYGAVGNANIFRICPKGGATLDSNYALKNMDVKAGSTSIPATSLVTGEDGEDLAVNDPAGQAKTKLNAFLTTLTSYNNIDLKTWVDGSLYPRINNTFTALNEIKLPTIKYAVNNGALKLLNIEGTEYVEIYTVSGSKIKQLEVTSNLPIQLAKGVYLVCLKGFAPQKVVI